MLNVKTWEPQKWRLPLSFHNPSLPPTFPPKSHLTQPLRTSSHALKCFREPSGTTFEALGTHLGSPLSGSFSTSSGFPLTFSIQPAQRASGLWEPVGFELPFSIIRAWWPEFEPRWNIWLGEILTILTPLHKAQACEGSEAPGASKGRL